MPPSISSRTISSKAVRTGAVMAVMAGLAGCGGGKDSGGTTGDAGSGQTVLIRDFKFEPANLTATPGAKVTVKNEDGAAHTLTADDRSFDTGNIEGKGQKEITAPSTGRVAFKCEIHQYMTGVIRVDGS